MAEDIHVKMLPELRLVIERMANEQSLPMGEVCVRLIAQALNKPELGIVPRKPMGRPRKQMTCGR